MLETRTRLAVPSRGGSPCSEAHLASLHVSLQIHLRRPRPRSPRSVFGAARAELSLRGDEIKLQRLPPPGVLVRAARCGEGGFTRVSSLSQQTRSGISFRPLPEPISTRRPPHRSSVQRSLAFARFRSRTQKRLKTCPAAGSPQRLGGLAERTRGADAADRRPVPCSTQRVEQDERGYVWEGVGRPPAEGGASEGTATAASGP